MLENERLRGEYIQTESYSMTKHLGALFTRYCSSPPNGSLLTLPLTVSQQYGTHTHTYLSLIQITEPTRH